jgi:hypothetical protein
MVGLPVLALRWHNDYERRFRGYHSLARIKGPIMTRTEANNLRSIVDVAPVDGLELPNLDGLSTDPADLEIASRVFGLFAAYADALARAKELRAKGDVEAALSFERSADATYKRMPLWARW